MRTLTLNFAVGQRYRQTMPDAADRYWSLDKILPPSTMQAEEVLVLTAERDGATMRRTAPVLAHEIYTGAMACAELPEGTRTSHSLANLVLLMSPAQLKVFKLRSAYVTAVRQAEGVGLSWKDGTFKQLVADTFKARMEAWQKETKAHPGRPQEPIEEKAPSCYSVDRWFRKVRKASGDLTVLAMDAFATQTRTARKPKERALLDAFLRAKLAEPVKYTASGLHSDFNRLLKKLDPLKTDEMIDELLKQAKETERNNRLRRAKGSINKSKKGASQPSSTA